MNFVGIDLHKKTISVCVVNQGRKVLARQTLDCRDPQRILSWFGQLGTFQAVVEATASYEWLWQLLEPLADRRVHPDHFETSRLSGPVMSMYVSMIRNRDARDWLTNEPLDGSVLGHNASLTVHHFFPRSLLRKHNYGSDNINTFANYTLLSLKGNLEAGTEEPATYLARRTIPEDQLRLQCIPPDQQLWRVERYEDFLVERRKLLAQSANEFLGM